MDQSSRGERRAEGSSATTRSAGGRAGKSSRRRRSRDDLGGAEVRSSAVGGWGDDWSNRASRSASPNGHVGERGDAGMKSNQ